MNKTILNKKYAGQTFSTGSFPKPIIFDELTDNHIGFLKNIGMDFLLIEVCEICLKNKCRCKKIKK
jgi:hypothetical protein